MTTTATDGRRITASGLVYLITTPTAAAMIAARAAGARYVPRGERRDGVQGPAWYLPHDWRGTLAAWHLATSEGFARDEVTRRVITVRLPDAVRLKMQHDRQVRDAKRMTPEEFLTAHRSVA